MTQAARVLRALERAGDRGLTAADFSGLSGTPDGLPPITRVAARILELRGQGHVIVEAGTRDRCRVYRIVQALPVSLPDAPDVSPSRLFSPAGNAILGDAA